MKFERAVCLAGLIFSAALPAAAHHSFAAEFESQLFVVEGTVNKVDWKNPHVWIYVDVADTKGNKEQWECEGGAPNGLLGNGWTRNTLKPGDRVTMAAHRAKDRHNVCKARYVQLSDGRKLFMGGPGDGAPPSQ